MGLQAVQQVVSQLVVMGPRAGLLRVAAEMEAVLQLLATVLQMGAALALRSYKR